MFGDKMSLKMIYCLETTHFGMEVGQKTLFQQK